jgi:hypothetical protein
MLIRAATAAWDSAQPSSRAGRPDIRALKSWPGTGGVQPVSAASTASLAYSVIAGSFPAVFCASRAAKMAE